MKTNDDGFTLLEMIVTLALMSLALATVLPSVMGSRGNSIDATASQIAAVMRLAQSRAISQNLSQTLVVDVGKRTLDSGQHASLLHIAEDYDMKVTFARGTDGGGSPAFVFFADGQTTGGKVELSRKGDHRSIALNWVTGAVTVSTP
jgi:general secretion pathway protein H